MAFSKNWMGRVYGTNTGNLAMLLSGTDEQLEGKIRLADNQFGVAVYDVTGSFDGDRLQLTGSSQTTTEGVTYGTLTARGRLNPRGELVGEWETTIGTGGTFHLFPHESSDDMPPANTGAPATETPPDQLHTARANFNFIAIDREGILRLAEELQKDFKVGKLAVTVRLGTEQARFLEDFRRLPAVSDKTDFLKLFVQEPEINGINKLASIEFGPQLNHAMTQGFDEAWVLGKMETIKREVARFERSYAASFKKYGITLINVLMAWVLVYLPSLPDTIHRLGFLAAVIFAIRGFNYVHARYIPHALIYLSTMPPSKWSRFWPAFLSWTVATLTAIAVAVFSVYLDHGGSLPDIKWLAHP